MSESRPNDQILFAYERLEAFLRASAWQRARNWNLTPTQAEALAHLARRGPSRNAEVAAMLGITAATLSDSVTTLVAKGHVLRQPDPTDGRAQRLVLTPAGAEVAATLGREDHALGDVVAALPTSDQGALLRILTTLIRGLQEARAIPAQRMCVTCKHFRPNVHDDAGRPHHCEFVNAAFGDASLRLDCGEHEPARAEEVFANWQRFQTARAE